MVCVAATTAAATHTLLQECGLQAFLVAGCGQLHIFYRGPLQRAAAHAHQTLQIARPASLWPQEALRRAPGVPELFLVLDVVYGPDLPEEEVIAAVGADAVGYGPASQSVADAARVLRSQAVYRQPPLVQRRMLMEVCSLRPEFLDVEAFLDALCDLQASSHGRCW